MTVGDLMTSKVFSVGEHDDLATVYDLMDSHAIRYMPVINKQGELLGLITQRDLLRGGFFASEGLTVSARREVLRAIKVSQVMTEDVATASAEDPIDEAGLTLLENKCDCLPVVEGARLVGILTEADFVRHIVQNAA